MKTPKLPERPAELIELEARRAAIRQQRQEVEDELRQINDEAWGKTQLDVDPLDAVAEKLARGEIGAATREVLPQELEILRARLELLVLAEQKIATRVAEQRDRHNRSAAGVYRPDHKKAAQRIARALHELVDANRAEQELRDKAPGGQFPPMDFPGVGQLGAAGGPAKFWMEHAARHGYLADEDEANLPAAAQ